MPRPSAPSAAALEAEFRRLPDRAQLAARFGVSESTLDGWCRKYGLVPPWRGKRSRWTGGRRYKAPGRPLPGHVTIEQARALRQLHAEHPDWSHSELAGAVIGVDCSDSMISLILAGKRILDPAAFPPAPTSTIRSENPQRPALVFGPRVPRKQ